MFRTRDDSNRDMRRSSTPESDAGGTPFDYPEYFGDNLVVVDDPRRPSKAPIPNPTNTALHYLVPFGATGAWVGHVGAFVTWDGVAWAFSQPTMGTKVYVKNQYYHSALTYTLEKAPTTAESQSNTGVEDGTNVGSGGSTYGAGFRSNVDVFCLASGGYHHTMSWIPEKDVDSLHSLFCEAIENATTTAPPASPAEYSRYIIASVATGIWATYEKHIALCVTDYLSQTQKWILTKPRAGAIVYNKATNSWLWYNGVTLAWEDIGHTHALNGHSDTNLGTPGAPEDGYAVTWDDATSKYVLTAIPPGGAHALDGHTDTNLGAPGAPEDGYVVAWDNGTSKYTLQAPTAPGAHALGSHSDTVLGSPGAPEDGYYVGWNQATAKYTLKALTVPSHNHTLDSLSNVSTGGKVSGSNLKWNGSAWVVYTPSLSALSDVTISGPTTNQVLTYNGSKWVNGTVSATVPSGTGRLVAEFTSTTVTFDIVGSVANVDTSTGSNAPNFLVPSGYTKARITVRGTYTAGWAVGVYTTSGNRSTGTPDAVYHYIIWPTTGYGCFTIPALVVTAGLRLFPYYNNGGTAPASGTSTLTIPACMDLELFT